MLNAEALAHDVIETKLLGRELVKELPKRERFAFHTPCIASRHTWFKGIISTDEYSQRLDGFVNELVPPVLMNDEYAARCSALLIALNRQLARCAASFSQVHAVEPSEMLNLVFAQFHRNFRISLGALEGAGEAVQ